MSPEDIARGFPETVRALLAEVRVMTLATAGDAGPWAADVYFAAGGLRLYFWSSPESRHCRDLAQRPACAATVHPVSHSWQGITGLQLAGHATAVCSDEVHRARKVYLDKFSFAAPLVDAEDSSAVPWVLEVGWVRLIDNTAGFGLPWSAQVVDGELGPAVQENPSRKRR